MIDTTYEIDDIKAELQSWQVYKDHYAAEDDFNDALEKFCDEVMREEMLNIMSKSVYTNLQTQGKTGLQTASDVTLINAYWAEVYYTVGYFYRYMDRLDKAARIGYTETRGNPQGESRTVSGYSGKSAVASDYIQRADTCMQRAGFNAQSKMKVRGSIHA